MATKIGDFKIKIYKNNSIYISLPEDEFLQVVMFGYYFDRVVHDLSKENYPNLINGFYNTSSDFYESVVRGKAKNIETLVKKSAFNLFHYVKNNKKADFEVYAEYSKKNKEFFYLITKFKPLFASNLKLENWATVSVMAYFDYLLLTLPKLRIMFLIAFIKIMTEFYIESLNENKMPQLNEAAVKGLNGATDFMELVTKSKM